MRQNYRNISTNKNNMEQNISMIKQRIIQFAESHGYSKRKIYQETGLSNGVLDKKTGLSEDGIEKFISTYKDVNLTWLITGEGEMLANNPPPLPSDVCCECVMKDKLISMQEERIAELKERIAELKNHNEYLKEKHAASAPPRKRNSA